MTGSTTLVGGIQNELKVGKMRYCVRHAKTSLLYPYLHTYTRAVPLPAHLKYTSEPPHCA